LIPEKEVAERQSNGGKGVIAAFQNEKTQRGGEIAKKKKRSNGGKGMSRLHEPDTLPAHKRTGGADTPL